MTSRDRGVSEVVYRPEGKEIGRRWRSHAKAGVGPSTHEVVGIHELDMLDI